MLTRFAYPTGLQKKPPKNAPPTPPNARRRSHSSKSVGRVAQMTAARYAIAGYR